ncbi:MAG: 7-cyano-7-deazaguanine synthase QueC [Syntrophales bacterium]|nr:7-cyano-7-deazaguanine synthase QueC [Syntrophales bacterium]
MKQKQKVVVLVSGGMDSVTALYEADLKYHVVYGISFNYGAKHNSREIPFAAYHCRKLGIRHEVISLDFIARLFKSDLLETGGKIPEGHYEELTMKQTVVPFRNGIMMSIVAGFAESVGATGLVIAAHSGDHAIYPDCREDFMISMGEAIRLGTYVQVEVIRPFITMSKAEIAKRGLELGVDFSQTWSCYKGANLHCGKCGTCVERREAFILAKIKDPTAYEEIVPLPDKPTG